jgi:hypothetical protein
VQAHDFEAYQEMLQAQAGASGAPAAGERYEQISKFLHGAPGQEPQTLRPCSWAFCSGGMRVT